LVKNNYLIRLSALFAKKKKGGKPSPSASEKSAAFRSEGVLEKARRRDRIGDNT